MRVPLWLKVYDYDFLVFHRFDGVGSNSVVDWFKDRKGFKFITPNIDGVNLFVNQSSTRLGGF